MVNNHRGLPTPRACSGGYTRPGLLLLLLPLQTFNASYTKMGRPQPNAHATVTVTATDAHQAPARRRDHRIELLVPHVYRAHKGSERGIREQIQEDEVLHNTIYRYGTQCYERVWSIY